MKYGENVNWLKRICIIIQLYIYVVCIKYCLSRLTFIRNSNPNIWKEMEVQFLKQVTRAMTKRTRMCNFWKYRGLLGQYCYRTKYDKTAISSGKSLSQFIGMKQKTQLTYKQYTHCTDISVAHLNLHQQCFL